jgi:hypothetical protein
MVGEGGGELGGGFMLLGRVDGTSSCGEYGVGEEWWWVRDVQSEWTIGFWSSSVRCTNSTILDFTITGTGTPGCVHVRYTRVQVVEIDENTCT